ncbi:MAG: DUF3734 domain-containing protein, partial [Burkholderiales bacterium]
AKHMRLTVGAVNVRSGQMHYFDNRECAITAAYIMASSALPPAFPAVRVGDDLYWDGGIYSNTPIEVVFDDRPRRDSVIFTVNLWHARGPEPKSIWQVLERHKDIQYASRVESHHDRQQQLHRLRHVIRALEQHIPEAHRSQPEVQELLAYGCATHMHIIQLLAPRLEGEDHTKDIDFTQNGIRARWQAGYAHARRAIAEAPWRQELHPLDGAVVHEPS